MHSAFIFCAVHDNFEVNLRNSNINSDDIMRQMLDSSGDKLIWNNGSFVYF